jgi:hypothetical protein
MLNYLFDKTLVLFHEIENQRNPNFVLLNDYVK